MDPKKAARLVWGTSPAGITHAPDLKPGSREFFEKVRLRRSAYELPWLAKLVPFSAAKGKKVLEIGCGAGYDAFEFCQGGADYTGIDIAPENVVLTQKHLGFYGFSPQVYEGDAENLPFSKDNFESVFSNGVLHHVPDIDQCFREVYRVLKKGGLFWVIVYHKNSIFYWITLFLYHHILRLGFLKMSFKKRLSMIELNTTEETPLVNVYTRGGLKKKLQTAGFQVDEVWVRKLNPEDLPFGKQINRFIPSKVWEWCGKRFGWYVIAQAVKDENPQ